MMNKTAILHIQDSPYCFPTDTDEMVLRLRTAKNDVDRVSLIYENKYVIWQSQRTAPLEKAFSDELFDWFEIRIRLTDTRLAYVFLLENASEKYYFSEDGLSLDYDFKLGYYNFFQYPYINEADIVRPVGWMKNAVFYQIFIDRFNRGILNKDDSYINMKPGDDPTPFSFAGGDIPGIIDKIDYLQGLGVSALYLTPVFTSRSNHKYDISDYYTVDEQFGTNDDLKKLVEACHKRGMRIVLDAVFNHVSSESAMFKDVVEKGTASEYYDWFVVHGDRVDTENCNYETFASCEYMPKLNTSNPEVQKFLCDIAVHYVRDYDTDGWRLDVADEISQDFWRGFRRAVKAVKRDAVIIAEDWHDAYRNLRGDQYDSIMNYAFTKTMLDYFAYRTKDAQAIADKLTNLELRNKEGVNKMMLNLLDSHDTHRFYTMVNEKRNAVKSALAVLFFYQGTPCMYYGTEILMPGDHDPGCRRYMDWAKTEEGSECYDVIELIRKLAHFRASEHVDDGVYRYEAKDDVLVIRSLPKEKFTVYQDEAAGCADGEAGANSNEYALYVNNTDAQKIVEGISLQAESFAITKNGQVIL